MCRFRLFSLANSFCDCPLDCHWSTSSRICSCRSVLSIIKIFARKNQNTRITLQEVVYRWDTVVGYFETLDIISETYENISISESSLKNLHNILLKYSKKDEWHKGDYKQHSNAVEAKLTDGTRQIIFQTTEAGFPTQDAVRLLIDWYINDKATHPLVKCSLYCSDTNIFNK